MIPKRIFYVWGYSDPKKRDVLACMLSWREVCKNYEIIEINEKSTKYFDFQAELKNNEWFKTVYDLKLWAYVADYVRAKVLYDHGGIYLDTDVSVLKNFDAFLHEPAFVGMQDTECEGHRDLVEPAILGAQKGNPFLKEVCHFYENLIWHKPIFTLPNIFKYYLQQYKCPPFPPRGKQNIIRLKDISLYPESYFIPFRYEETFSFECIKKNTHTIHWFGGSWIKPEILNFLKHKHLGKEKTFSPSLLSFQETLKLFHVLPVLQITHYINSTSIKKYTFLKCISLTYKRLNDQTHVLSLFNCLNLIKIKNSGLKREVYLFSFIPLYSVKS